MGAPITLHCRSDGAPFEAYRAPADDVRRGGMVMLHAIWGVTPHIRELADSFAEQGYEVIAPSLLHRFEAGFPEANTDRDAYPRRAGYAEAVGWGEGVLGEVQAAIDALAPPVFVVGFCFGGTTAWLAACRCDGLAAASCFYGNHIVHYRTETPRCPTILHFGAEDPLTPPEDIDAIAAAQPELPIWIYEGAGHAFMAPSDHHPDAARLARLRTLQLFHRSASARPDAGA